MEKEQVNHPAHYNLYPVEAIDMMIAIWGKEKTIDFCYMNDLKYIIVQLIKRPSIEKAIVFNGLINHCDVVPDKEVWNVVSAGFCIINVFSVEVYGGSESLNLTSRKKDAKVIYNTINRSNSLI